MFALLPLMAASCSVIPKNIRSEAVKDVDFNQLVQNADQYIGKTVILGGYIIEVQNMADQTRLLVLQTPLGYEDQPKARDLSQGRFMVVYDGFLDPAVYEKNRKVTVAGTVKGAEKRKIDRYTYPLLVINAIDLYLWEPESQARYYNYPYYPYSPYYPYPWPSPDPFWRYRHPYPNAWW